MNPRTLPFFAVVICLLTGPHFSHAQQLTATPYRSDGIYQIGEPVGWTISSTIPGSFKYIVRKNNFELIKSGDLDLSGGPAKIEVTLNDPAMVYLEFPDVPAPTTPSAGRKPPDAFGAAVAPEKLQPSIPRPADFDEFWDSKIKLLNQIPPDAVLTPKDAGRPDIDYAIIRMDNINDGHIHGQIAKPRRGGKFPGLLILQYAGGPYALEPQWVINRAAQGWLAVNIEPHDVLPDQPRSYYEALPDSLKHYQTIGRDDRDTCYFLRMYLADYRAVEYLTGRPDWDGKTLMVMGGSMGGQQSLCVAGLNRKITGVIVEEPSGCDANGPLHGRASGYPNWPCDNPKIMQTAQYFDVVNFASRITVPSLVAMGFVDTTAPPVGIWTAFNQIQGPKEAVPMIDSPHNNLSTAAQRRPYTSKSEQWLGILVHGGHVPPE